jgi:alkylation response protein AidB-like acyl-CoA dehydrogenase
LETNRLGKEGQGFKIAMAGLDGGRLNIAACSIGAANACLNIVLSHMKVVVPKQFSLNYIYIMFRLFHFMVGQKCYPK